MAMTETITKCRKVIHTTSSNNDDELNDCIEACLADLQQCGIECDETNPSILYCIKMYCRANFEPDLDVARECQSRYNDQKSHLMMTEGFGL